MAIFLAFGAVTFLSQCIYGLGREQETGILYYYWLYEAPVSFRSHINALRFVFQICIPTWLSCLMFLDSYRNPRYYVVIIAPLLFGTVFSFITLTIIMMILFCATVAQSKENWFVQIKRAFSSPNLAVLIGGILIPGIYLMGNVLGDKPAAAGFSLIRYNNDTAIIYFSFISGFLCYSLLIWRLYEQNLLFYLINGIMLVIPFVGMGPNNDLGMDCTIATLFFLMIFIIKTVFDHTRPEGIRRTAMLVVLIFWSGVYLVYDIDDILKTPISIDGSNRAVQYQSLENMSRNPIFTIDWRYNYYTLDPNDSVFVRYMATDKPGAYNAYVMGTELPFSAIQMNARYFLTDLTADIDTNLVWSEGNEASLSFLVGDVDKDVKVFIQYGQTVEGAQRVIVSCQGQTLCTNVVDANNLLVEFVFPKELIRDRAINFTIEYPDAVVIDAQESSDEVAHVRAVSYQKMILNTIE